MFHCTDTFCISFTLLFPSLSFSPDFSFYVYTPRTHITSTASQFSYLLCIYSWGFLSWFLKMLFTGRNQFAQFAQVLKSYQRPIWRQGHFDTYIHIYVTPRTNIACILAGFGSAAVRFSAQFLQYRKNSRAYEFFNLLIQRQEHFDI